MKRLVLMQYQVQSVTCQTDLLNTRPQLQQPVAQMTLLHQSQSKTLGHTGWSKSLDAIGDKIALFCMQAESAAPLGQRMVKKIESGFACEIIKAGQLLAVFYFKMLVIRIADTSIQCAEKIIVEGQL